MGLYTVGYIGWDYEKLIETLCGLGEDVLVYDVRYRPASRRPEFSRKRLSERLGARYIHAQGLGNIDYKTNNIKLMCPEPWYQEIEERLRQGKIAVLMCMCAKLDVCHRLVLTKELEKRCRIKAEHLIPAKREPKKKAKKKGLGIPSLFDQRAAEKK